MTTVQAIDDGELSRRGVRLFVKRDDLLDPQGSGNKWRKLKYNLLAAREKGHDTLLTLGGAYSNHIYATAAAAESYGFKSIGIIRGEPHDPLNSTLQFAHDQGMVLHYVRRCEYRRRHTAEFVEQLRRRFGDFYFLPEGGSNALAVRGCVELVAEIEVDFDYLCTPCGTGGTLAGIVAGLAGRGTALGFSALKGGQFIEREVRTLLADSGHRDFDNWAIETDYHFGGYAKIQPALIEFIEDFRHRHHIPLEPIYTGKMMYGIYDCVRRGRFPIGSRIVAVHTGGLQGLAGIRERYGIVFD